MASLGRLRLRAGMVPGHLPGCHDVAAASCPSHETPSSLSPPARRAPWWSTTPIWRFSAACWPASRSSPTSLRTHAARPTPAAPVRPSWVRSGGSVALVKLQTNIRGDYSPRQPYRLNWGWGYFGGWRPSVPSLCLPSVLQPHPASPASPPPPPGDMNTMAHGIARLSPHYCCDQMRFRRVAAAAAARWQRRVH